MNNKGNAPISFTIERHIGVIASYKTGWKKELNLVSWNEANSKYDIRDWDPEHAHMSRGITLRKEEAETLLELLKDEDLKLDCAMAEDGCEEAVQPSA